MRALKIFLCILVVGLCTVFENTASAQNKPDSISEILEALEGYPCPDSDFTCVTLTVPLDHFSSGDERTLDVVFGVLPASGERKGMFVTATGGPGSSGLASADSYAAAMDPTILEYFDIVFFDQRGAYQSGNLQCPEAVTEFYSADWSAVTAAEEARLIQTARTFAEDCVREMNVDPSTLPFYGTNQAIEDLEVLRQAIGDDKLWLYGESYGTQYVQTYTTTYPDHVAGLILDGTVDLTMTGLEYYKEQTKAFYDVLQQTLEACREDSDCNDAMADDPTVFYDDLMAELRASGLSIEFPLPSGEKAIREFTFSDLETIAASQVYSDGGRMMFLRALAAASQGDGVPLLRLAYANYGLDPETETTITSASYDYSDALFYAVECNDYSYNVGSPEESAEAYIRAGDEIEETIPQLSSIFYGDLPCVFWPSNPPEERPAPLTAEGIPTLVLGATADPATPVENGKRVFEHLEDGYLITTQGGAHVIYGRGDSCPDDIVTAFLVDDERPDAREIDCEGEVAAPFAPIAPREASSFGDVLEALDSAYNEIYYLPEYYYWDYETLTLVGCPFGGLLAIGPSSTGDQLYLSNCAFSEGFNMTGRGEYDYESGDFTLNVHVSGLEDGSLYYVQDIEGQSNVSGTYGSEEIDLSS